MYIEIYSAEKNERLSSENFLPWSEARHIHHWVEKNAKLVGQGWRLSKFVVESLLADCHIAQLNWEEARKLFPDKGDYNTVDYTFYESIDKTSVLCSQLLRNINFKTENIIYVQHPWEELSI